MRCRRVGVHVCWLWSACTSAFGQVPEPVPLQACSVLLRDGRLLAADRLTQPVAGELALEGPDGSDRLPAADVIAVLGTTVAASTLPVTTLAGGDVIRGLLTGGDAAGDQLQLQSPTLGALRLPVDRLECLVLRPDLADAEDLALPDGADEALFREAALGFDRVVGTMHQFGEPGIRFQPGGQDAARWYSTRELVGLRLGGAVAAAVPAAALLCTRSGDRVGVRDVEFLGDALRATLEGGVTVRLPLADLACLVLLDRDVLHLAQSAPRLVSEAAFDGDVLMPWQRDRSVSGTPLHAGGRCYARGLGVHSRSRLEFLVPEGAVAFVARVAFDDSVLQLPVRGEVDVAVRVDDAVPFVHKGLRAGEPPRLIGPLPVRPGQLLSLEVEVGAGRDLGDRVDWLMPVFLLARGG